LVWVDNTPGNPEIYYKKSLDGGATWTTNKRLTFTSGNSWSSAIAVDASGKLHVIWQDNTPGNFEIYYKKSPDGGGNWTSQKRITFTSGDSHNPDITVDASGYLHAVWKDDTSGKYMVYYIKSKDGGATWTESKRLTWTSGNSENPAIGDDSSGNLHVVLQDNTPGNYEIDYKQSTDGGAAWTANKRLTWTAGTSEAPVIGVDSTGYLHVAWVDSTPGNTEIYHKKSTDGGATWGANRRLTYNSVGSYSPDIAADTSSRVHLVWVDETPGNPDIYYRKSADGGATWTTPLRLTWTPGFSEVPAIGVDSSGNLHVVWRDNTPGNYEIYYKKFK
jgi:predicted neuraminidase